MDRRTDEGRREGSGFWDFFFFFFRIKCLFRLYFVLLLCGLSCETLSRTREKEKKGSLMSAAAGSLAKKKGKGKEVSTLSTDVLHINYLGEAKWACNGLGFV